jgi:hypothetical protein
MPNEQSIDFSAAVEEVRVRTAELRDAAWSEGHRRYAGRTLAALAVALMAAPGGWADLSNDECVLRILAAQLQEEEASPFQTSARIKQGLEAALAAIAARRGAKQEHAALTGWIDAARRAVASIDGQSLLTFQRAPIQDAFRSISDLLRLWVQQT